MKRATTSTLDHATATCPACGWTATGHGALGNAAQHHDRTTHPTTTTITRTITYGTPADHNRALEAAGQGTLTL